MSKLLRSLFMAIDIEFIHLKDDLHNQYVTLRSELSECKAVRTINLDLVPKGDRGYLQGEVSKQIAIRFEYFLYRKAEQLFQNNSLTVKESVNNRSLSSDLIQPKEWQNRA